MITLIFDIDGTLVNSAAFEDELFIAALKEVVGDVFFRDDWASYDHVTDPGIVAQILRENGIENADEMIVEVRRCFGDLVKEYLQSNPCPEIQGAIHAVDKLRRDANVLLGLATGGWEHTARMKLHAAGFDVEDVPLLSGDDHHERVGIMRSCKDLIAPNEDKVVYVGDASWDLEATGNLHWAFVGVGEGLRHKADIWIPDFTSALWESAPDRALQLVGSAEHSRLA